jgi:hypothetical protein
MKRVTRRQALKGILLVPVSATFPFRVAEAAFPVLFGIMIRLLIGNAIRATVKAAAPALLSTAFRRYLIGVAIAYGISEAHAAILAEKAEQTGAKTIAKAGVKHDVLLVIENTSDSSVTFGGASLELVNLESNYVEFSHPVSGMRLPAKTAEELPVTIHRFKVQGPKQLRLVRNGQVIAAGEVFYAVV